MKKIKYLLIIFLGVIFLTGCSFFGDNLDGATIYVTNYPIKYLVESFYKDHADIKSIYPSDVDTTTYTLTDKQIRDYSKANMFVYNGLTNEKKLAKDFISKNDDLLILDVSYGLSYEYSTEELWLSPNNYLMLAKNVRDSFLEYLTNETIKEEINEHYTKLSETLSIMDADLRSIGSNAAANNKNIILVSNKAYKYLKNYGFNVICLEDEAYSTNDAMKTIQNNYKGKKYAALIYDPNDKSELVDKLLKENESKAIPLSKMTYKITDDDYISTLQQFLDLLKNLTSN